MAELIIYEDHDIIVAYKRAGLATQTARLGQADLVSMVKKHLGKDSYLALINRLDQPVEGLVLFAKTKKAAAKLSEQVQHKDTSSMEKYYTACVIGEVSAEEQTLTDYLIKDSNTNMSRVVSLDVAGAKKAILKLHGEEKQQELSEETGQTITVVGIHLLTGRHHQIRVQLANAGYPILGDQKYGKSDRRQLCLCASRLRFVHPITGKELDLSVKPSFL